MLGFVWTEDGSITGEITNGPAVGSWNGVLGNDGSMIADYAYPTFAARAIGQVTESYHGHIRGRMQFVADGQVFGEGQFDLRRVSLVDPAPMTGGGAQAPNPHAGAYPFNRDGMFVYCSAPSVCGKRGGNALPGNWGWTGGLFGDIKQNYPHVWCNLYPGSCTGQ